MKFTKEDKILIKVSISCNSFCYDVAIKLYLHHVIKRITHAMIKRVMHAVDMCGMLLDVFCSCYSVILAICQI